MPDAVTLPDLWQLEALAGLRAGDDVVLQAPTGAGKTLVFERWVEAGFRGQAVYAVPTRALANDKHAEWVGRGWDVGIATGDVSLRPRAPVLVATLETQRQRILAAGDAPRLLAIDEYQMLADPTRGCAYETVLGLAPAQTQLLLLSGSVGNPEAVADWLRGRGRKVRLVAVDRRPVPLEEVSLDALEERESPGVRGSLARAVIRALRADLGPVLIFAPRRRAAIQIAEELADALPLDGGPALAPSQRAVAGDALGRLLRHGIGLHHSGLTYEQRAGLIEPLAKAGSLRVVVATTGLAAGINFSLRSVLVTDRRYVSGHSVREVRPDELLQMFGRAGRRGLDDRGHALWHGDSPRLGEARPLQLRRSENLDWPAFLQRMVASPDPVAAAEAMAGTLFTREPIDLALRDLPEVPEEPAGSQSTTLRTVTEMQGKDGTWQRARPTRNAPMSEALIRVGDSWHPALEKPDSLRALPFGTPCRIEGPEGRVWHGRMVPLAHFPKSGARDTLETLDWLRRAWREHPATRGRPARLTLENIDRELLPLLPSLTRGGVAHGPPFLRGDTLHVRLDYSRAQVRVMPDAADHPLINPRLRTVERADINFGDVIGGGVARGGRDGRLWLRLGLIDRAGRVTRRGQIAARFQHGEGLAVAAALEDEAYGAEAIAWDLAELRAGERVADGGRSTSRLAARCRLTYRSITASGYLREGLPEGYGEGAAEILRRFALHRSLPTPTAEGQGGGRGDLERGLLEWRSCLRLIAEGDDHPWERWQALREAASRVLAQIGGAPDSSE